MVREADATTRQRTENEGGDGSGAGGGRGEEDGVEERAGPGAAARYVAEHDGHARGQHAQADSLRLEQRQVPAHHAHQARAIVQVAEVRLHAAAPVHVHVHIHIEQVSFGTE